VRALHVVERFVCAPAGRIEYIKWIDAAIATTPAVIVLVIRTVVFS
jgi:hypothetical protein